MSAHALPTSRSKLRLRPLRRRGDDDLRAAAAAGDAAAFAELYERHHQALYRYCRSIVRHDEDALDALHNTWTNAWGALQHADRDVPVRPWLFRIAHNEAVSLLRRRRHHDDLDEVAGLGSAVLDHDVEVRERLALLQADLGELPERQRSALLLRELCGMGHDEIAAVIDTSPSAAKQSIYEARAALQVAQEGRSMSCDEIQRMLSDGDGRVGRGRKVRAHLRSCEVCRGFQAAIGQRRADVAMLAPPLPIAAAAGVLARVLSHTSGHGGLGGAVAPAAASTGVAASGGAAAPVSTSGATALTAKVGGGLLAKVAIGAAIVATAGTGVTAAHHVFAPHAHAASDRGGEVARPTTFRIVKDPSQSGAATQQAVAPGTAGSRTSAATHAAGSHRGGAAGSHGVTGRAVSSAHRRDGAAHANALAHGGHPGGSATAQAKRHSATTTRRSHRAAHTAPVHHVPSSTHSGGPTTTPSTAPQPSSGGDSSSAQGSAGSSAGTHQGSTTTTKAPAPTTDSTVDAAPTVDQTSTPDANP